MRVAGRGVPAAGLGAVIAALMAFTVVAQGFALPDESWFLQVVARVQGGETLYRDVYFNTTPLSVYVTVALTSIFSTELAVVRAVVAAALVATIALGWLVCRELEVGWVAAWLLVCAWNRPAPYTPLAMLFFMAAFLATVVWMRRARDDGGGPRQLVLAGAAAALSFGAKHNVGAYALAAVLLAVIVASGPGRLAVRRGAVVLAAFVLGVSVLLLPVVVTGGAARFLVFGFAKGTYLTASGVSYSAAVDRFADAISAGAVVAAYRELAFAVPVVVCALLAIVCLRSEGAERRLALVVTGFVTAGYLVVFPHQGGSLIAFAIPILVVGLAYGWSRVRPLLPLRLARTIQVAVSVLFLAQVGIRLARDGTAVLAREYVTSEIPHFRGLRVRAEEHRALRGQAALLSELAARQPLFLIGPNAGFFYLAAGIRNPSAFDFPYASVFGTRGQQEVIACVRSGDIPSVFVFAGPVDRQTPTALLDVVRSWLAPAHEGPLGALYGRAPPRY